MEQERQICASCNTTITGNVIGYEGRAYCHNCVTHCSDCSMAVPNNELEEYDGHSYCRRCMTTCEDCGENVPYAFTCRVGDGDECDPIVCDSCRDEDYFRCEVCDRLIHVSDGNDATLRYSTGNEVDTMVCDECVEHSGDIDNEDGALIIYREDPFRNSYPTGAQNDPHRITREYYNLEKLRKRCPQCNFLPDACPDCKIIQAKARKEEELTLWVYDTQHCMYHDNFHNRFKTLKYRTKHEHPFLYYGIELEVIFSNKANKAKVVHDFIVATNGMFVSEYDSSVDRLGNGAEFISRPMSYKAWTSPEVRELLQRGFDVLQKNGAQVIQPDGCGLHVHMSLDFFTKNTEKDVDEIKNDIDWIFQTFQPEVEVISRRKYNNYCSSKVNRVKQFIPAILSVQGINLKMQLERGGLPSSIDSHDNHHYAIVMTRNTIEIRTFRSTIDVDTLLMTIQFCRAVAHASRNLTITEETTFGDIIHCKEGEELTRFVEKKKLDCSKKFKKVLEV